VAIAAGEARGKSVEVWFADESGVGQKNTISRRWARRGTRPSAPKDQRTASADLFGAICPATGAALVRPRCSTQGVNLHLAEIAQAVTPGAPRCGPARPGGLAPLEEAGRARERRPHAALGQGPRVEPGGECLAVHAGKLALESGLHVLRRHALRHLAPYRAMLAERVAGPALGDVHGKHPVLDAGTPAGGTQ
jgi:hypothetical protein